MSPSRITLLPYTASVSLPSMPAMPTPALPVQRVVVREGRVLGEGEVFTVTDGEGNLMTYGEVRNGVMGVNATLIGKNEGKAWSNWYRLDGTRALLDEMEKKRNPSHLKAGSVTQPSDVKAGLTEAGLSIMIDYSRLKYQGADSDKLRGTWVHTDVAAAFAQHISPAYHARWCAIQEAAKRDTITREEEEKRETARRLYEHSLAAQAALHHVDSNFYLVKQLNWERTESAKTGPCLYFSIRRNYILYGQTGISFNKRYGDGKLDDEIIEGRMLILPAQDAEDAKILERAWSRIIAGLAIRRGKRERFVGDWEPFVSAVTQWNKDYSGRPDLAIVLPAMPTFS
ncbi:hypothetical protein GHT06_003793 [Daphnia sinensis]|uniref:KilA-N domain-containing protein n=1 Tax=Daphnia sinensis TaxID=1820382 RepID=A0AAD5KET5_9CRUS|nr:hypothetical protein GHT06_003793 [Daphnia sinensis]